MITVKNLEIEGLDELLRAAGAHQTSSHGTFRLKFSIKVVPSEKDVNASFVNQCNMTARWRNSFGEILCKSHCDLNQQLGHGNNSIACTANSVEWPSRINAKK